MGAPVRHAPWAPWGGQRATRWDFEIMAHAIFIIHEGTASTRPMHLNAPQCYSRPKSRHGSMTSAYARGSMPSTARVSLRERRATEMRRPAPLEYKRFTLFGIGGQTRERTGLDSSPFSIPTCDPTSVLPQQVKEDSPLDLDEQTQRRRPTRRLRG